MALLRSSYVALTAAVFTVAFLCVLLAVPARDFPQLPRIIFSAVNKQPTATTPSIEKPSPVESSVNVSGYLGATISPIANSFPSEFDNESMDRPVLDSEIVTESAKLTPDVLLTAPRRSDAIPNSAGSLALYTVSTYSFESHIKTKEIRLFDVASKRSTLITNDEKTSEPHWLEDEIVYLREGDDGSTEVKVASVSGVMKTYTAAVIPGSVSDFKLKVLSNGKVAFVCQGKATRDGELYNSTVESKWKHTGMLYDSLMVRHWDEYVDTNTNSLWYGVFSLAKKHISEPQGRYSISPLVNALKNTKLESPIPPFTSTSHFDISPLGISFVAKDPNLDPAYNTKCNFYYLPISDFTKGPTSTPQKVQLDGFEGAATGISFSFDGKSAVFLQMKENGYESDKNRVILIQDIFASQTATEIFQSDDGHGRWDRSPTKTAWSHDSRTLFFIAPEEGRSLVWKYDILDLAQKNLPTAITSHGSVSDIVPLVIPRLFLSGTSHVDNSIWSVVDLVDQSTPQIISSNTRNGAAFGLRPEQVSEIWFTGAKGRKLHAWVLKPSHEGTVYTNKLPLAFLIHGGPQGAWEDSWSTRWNPAVFAEQGYVVVTPNPTGSTSYGQNLTDAIQNNWGGDPYEDLVACFDYIKDNMDWVDTNRAVALGASYGGYMINWINGHDLGRKFKSLVCHDGVFSVPNAISQDEQYFPIHDLKGPFWKATENYDKWDPARHTGNWATPQLVIHSTKDYRLAISEGISAFNVLQGRGIDSRFLTFSDENHWVSKEENSLVWHTVVINWINRFVGLPPVADEDEVVGPVSGRDWRKKEGVVGG